MQDQKEVFDGKKLGTKISWDCPFNASAALKLSLEEKSSKMFHTSCFLLALQKTPWKHICTIKEILIAGLEVTKEILAEILIAHEDILEEIAIHDQKHKAILIQKIVFSFVTIKGKHLCRSFNIEENSLTRHKNMKTVLFQHK